MRARLATAASLLVLTACQPFEGQLKVSEPTKFILKKTIFGNTKKATIRPGQYKTKLSFTSKTKAKLIIEADKKYTVKLELPKGDELPRYYGNVSYSASQINQPFDLKGNVDSQESFSDNVNTFEACTYTRPETVCRMVEVSGREGHGARREADLDNERRGNRDRNDGDRRSGERPNRSRRERVCKTEYVTVYGQQRVEYYYKYTDSKINLKLLSPGTNQLLSRFSGDRHESDKIYTHKGRCR